MAADASTIRLMKTCSGMGMEDCKKAACYADDHLDGDYLLALLMAQSNRNAVMIRSRDPAISDAQARERYNLANARHQRDQQVADPDWQTLAAISSTYQGDLS